MLKNIRISVKLTVVGLLVIVIPLAAVTFLAVQRSAAATTAIETEQLARGARLIAGTIDGVFQEEIKVADSQASTRRSSAPRWLPESGRASRRPRLRNSIPEQQALQQAPPERSSSRGLRTGSPR